MLWARAEGMEHSGRILGAVTGGGTVGERQLKRDGGVIRTLFNLLVVAGINLN